MSIDDVARTIFERLDHCDGTIACPDRESYRYTGRAFREDDPSAPVGAWGIYDRKFERYVHRADIPKIDADERLVS